MSLNRFLPVKSTRTLAIACQQQHRNDTFVFSFSTGPLIQILKILSIHRRFSIQKSLLKPTIYIRDNFTRLCDRTVFVLKQELY